MYNLLMKSSGDHNDWEENQGRLYDVSFFAGRIFQYTEATVRQQFATDGDPDFNALTKLPCLFTYEGSDVPASIGRISEVRTGGGKYWITYTLPSIYPRIRLNEDFVFEVLGIGVGRSYEQSRTHWAVKDVDLFEVMTRLLHKAGNVPIVLSSEEMNRSGATTIRGRSWYS